MRRIKEIKKVKKQGRTDYGTGSAAEKPSTSHAVDEDKIEVAVGTDSSGENIAKFANDIDIAIEYHEELCSIVSETVSAYCPWFVMHWLCYEATCLIGVIYISEEFTYSSSNPLKLAYISVFFVTHLYMFLLPCICAACITDTCGGMLTI